MNSSYKPHEIRRNYVLLVTEGVLFTVGLVFFDPNTVVPLLMERLTGSALLVGMVAAVQPLCKGFVPILAGNRISALTRKKRFLISMVAIGRLPLWILALGLFLVPGAPAWAWAVILLLVQILFWFGDAAGDPAWMDMVGKSVEENRRGRFFATRQVVGGLLSLAGGAAVAAVLGLEGLSFPSNYGIVVLIGAFLFLANVGTFTGLVEHPAETSPQLPLRSLIAQLPVYLKQNSAFARTMAVLVLFNMAHISMPFFIVFGRRVFGLADNALGIIIPVQMAGRICGALLWGTLGDNRGHERAIRGVTMVSIIPPLLALALGFVAPQVAPVIPFAMLFFVLGLSLEGWSPYINYMLDVVPTAERPLYAGLMGVGYVPATLAPIVGGIIVQQLGYEALFVITAALTGAGLIVSFALPAAERQIS